MDVNSTPAYRSAPYDRTPLSGAIGYVAAAIAPHAFVERASYTVPANRKAVVTAASLTAMRQTVAGTSGLVGVELIITPSGGSSVRAFYIPLLSNTAGDYASKEIPVNIYLVEGDEIAIYTNDVSTTGTIHYAAGIMYTEFDA